MTIDDKTLDQRLAALDRHCDPPAESWETIAAQLPARGARRRAWPWLAVAAALGGLVVGLLVLLDQAGPWRLGPVPQWVDEASPVMEPMDQDWRPALQRQAVFNAAWDENEAAIRALEEALALEPDNLLLMEFLAEARLRQSKLIELALRIDELEAPSGVQI